jgi:flagellin-like protein
MVKSRDSYYNNARLKGISPVVATILMVMITVVLVAFSYSWLQNTVTGTQEQTGNVLSQADKMNQKVDIPTIYQCGADICFQLKAYTTNSYSVEMNSTSYYLHNVPKSVVAWDGGVSGASCTTTNLLAPGGSCYGKIAATTCQLSQNDFKVSLAWGATSTKSISGCN